MLNKFQQFKNRKTLYGRLTPNNIAELNLWYIVHVDKIGPYRKSIIKHQVYGATIKNYVSLTCIKMVESDMGWFGIVKVLKFGIYKVAVSSDEYINKSYDRVSCLFDNTWLIRYPFQHKVVFYN